MNTKMNTNTRPARLRSHEKIGAVHLSMQASRFHYCSPQEDSLPLEQYESVEIALLDSRSLFVLPSQVDKSLHKFDSLWGNDDVAAYVPYTRALKLRAALIALEARQGK